MTNLVSETYGSFPYPNAVRPKYRPQESDRYRLAPAHRRDDLDRTAVVLGVATIDLGDTKSALVAGSLLRTFDAPAARIWRNS